MSTAWDRDSSFPAPGEPPPPAGVDLAALTREATRLYRRYALEVVERFAFCPYAERARLDAKSREVVVALERRDVAAILEEVAPLAADERVEVAFILLPLLRCTRLELARFVEEVRAAHQSSDGGLVMTMEGFHPDAAPDQTSAAKLVPFLRRTPDPTIQLTRLSALTKVRRGSDVGTAFVDLGSVDDVMAILRAPPPKVLAARIADTNHERVQSEGAWAVEQVLLDILRDRDETYARLGIRGCPAGAHTAPPRR